MIPADVRRWRQKLGWTQQRLAYELGVTFTTINRWEKGHVRPSNVARQLLQLLATRLGVPLEETVDTNVPGLDC